VIGATGHDRGARAVNVRVEQPNLVALLHKRDGEVYADGRLADAALACADRDDAFDVFERVRSFFGAARSGRLRGGLGKRDKRILDALNRASGDLEAFGKRRLFGHGYGDGDTNERLSVRFFQADDLFGRDNFFEGCAKCSE